MPGKELPMNYKYRIKMEEELLSKMSIRCKVCDAKMRRYRQDDKVYYFCSNCEPNRSVWIDMPDYLG